MQDSYVPLVSVETAHARLLVTVLWPNLTGELRRATIDALAARLTEDRCEHPGVFSRGECLTPWSPCRTEDPAVCSHCLPVYCPTCDHEIPGSAL